MGTESGEKVPLIVVAVKVFVVLMPGNILALTFPAHADLAASVGFIAGAIAQHFIEPRGTRRQLLRIVSIAVLLGVARTLLNPILLRYLSHRGL